MSQTKRSEKGGTVYQLVADSDDNPNDDEKAQAPAEALSMGELGSTLPMPELRRGQLESNLIRAGLITEETFAKQGEDKKVRETAAEYQASADMKSAMDAYNRAEKEYQRLKTLKKLPQQQAKEQKQLADDLEKVGPKGFVYDDNGRQLVGVEIDYKPEKGQKVTPGIIPPARWMLGKLQAH
jgi:hypothetical protein